MRVYRNLKQLPEFNRPIVTIGSYDGVHKGHRKIIQQLIDIAKGKNLENVVITFDPHPRHFLFPEQKDLFLINTIEEKALVMDNLGVNHMVVVPFDQSFADQSGEQYVEKFLVHHFNPSVIIIGYDHKFGKNRSANIDFLRAQTTIHNFDIVEIPKQEIKDLAISSTRIRQAIKNCEIQLANQLLGYEYEFRGQVIHGQKIGTSLGYPTANLKPLHDRKIIPGDGVYATKVKHEGKWLQGMLYIGYRPTLQGKERTIEVFIFDFDRNIYGAELCVVPVKCLRGDMTFDSLEELKIQITKDHQNAIKAFDE